mmetsp:Transcript_27402/g.79446  ORF Transcript_27402/g.79446 Transcript_27402/m.79446 type:complete len:314 (-) Transcript_27402:370-1311(-)
MKWRWPRSLPFASSAPATVSPPAVTGACSSSCSAASGRTTTLRSPRASAGTAGRARPSPHGRWWIALWCTGTAARWIARRSSARRTLWPPCPSRRDTSSSSRSAVGSWASATSSSRNTCASRCWRCSGRSAGCWWRPSSSTVSRTTTTLTRPPGRSSRMRRSRRPRRGPGARLGSRGRRRTLRRASKLAARTRRETSTRTRTARRPWSSLRASCSSSTCCPGCRANTLPRCSLWPWRASRRAACGAGRCSCRRSSGGRRVGYGASRGHGSSVSPTSASPRRCASGCGVARSSSAWQTLSWPLSRRYPSRSPRS